MVLFVRMARTTVVKRAIRSLSVAINAKKFVISPESVLNHVNLLWQTAAVRDATNYALNANTDARANVIPAETALKYLARLK